MQNLLGTAVMERATLLANHVLAGEPAAASKLRAHVGRRVELVFEGWPALLPPLPATEFRITPAALVEWCGGADASPASGEAEPADLRITVDASNPLLAAVQTLGGERPRVDVAGDAVFASDVNWLFDNLRWDLEDDLAKLMGPVPAREAARLGGVVAAGLRQAVSTLQGLAARGPGAGSSAR
jgi:ubiquinone biosynthesis accessory factor UbiJ